MENGVSISLCSKEGVLSLLCCHISLHPPGVGPAFIHPTTTHPTTTFVCVTEGSVTFGEGGSDATVRCEAAPRSFGTDSTLAKGRWNKIGTFARPFPCIILYIHIV